jgi:hypothetical protein
MEMEISGACHINATKMEINQVKADASGASHASFGKVNNLDSETSGASKISRQ